MKKLSICFIAVITIIFSYHATANSSAANGEIHFSSEDIKVFAKNVEKTLAKQGARVAILSRIGRPDEEMPVGLNYTHVGFAVYSSIQTEDGQSQPGYVIYNLYQKADDLDHSELIRDFPFDFYSAVYKLKTGVIIPKPALQEKLLQVLNSETYHNLHNPNYSAIANPFNSQFQNCTEHTMDVIQAALYQTDNKNQIKANLKQYFEPYTVPYNGFTVILGAMFSEDVAASDHQTSPFKTATYGSIKNYFQTYDLAQHIFELGKPNENH